MKLFITHTLFFRCTILIILLYLLLLLPSTCNQSIPTYLPIGIDNRHQSITTRIFAIDWSSIININRLTDIDWYRLITIIIDYRFHRLDTPGYYGLHLRKFTVTELIKKHAKYHTLYGGQRTFLSSPPRQPQNDDRPLQTGIRKLGSLELRSLELRERYLSRIMPQLKFS